MSDKPNQNAATEPAAHPAWLRAADGPMNPDRAMDLAIQVCQVTAERDWLLVCTEGSTAALLEVLVPAVDAMYAQWIDDLDPERQGSGPATIARRESFAALAAATAYCALTCSRFALAKVMAFRSRMSGQEERSATLAELAMTGAVMRCPWTPMASAGRATIAAGVLDRRTTAAK